MNQWIPDLVPRPTLTSRPNTGQTLESRPSIQIIEEQEGEGGDVDDEWVEFGVMELEEAMSRRKDPRSFSQIFCCGKCLTGPSEKNTSPYVANTINIVMILFNVLMYSYTLKGMWQWLIYLNIGLGLLTSMLMWCV